MSLSVVASAIDTPWLPLKPDGGNTETSSPAEKESETDTEADTETEADSDTDTETETKSDTDSETETGLQEDMTDGAETTPVDAPRSDLGFLKYVIGACALVAVIGAIVILIRQGKKANGS